MNFAVAVVRKDIGGILSWHARCLVPGCDWSGRGRTTEPKALEDAKKHGRDHALAERNNHA